MFSNLNGLAASASGVALKLKLDISETLLVSQLVSSLLRSSKQRWPKKSWHQTEPIKKLDLESFVFQKVFLAYTRHEFEIFMHQMIEMLPRGLLSAIDCEFKSYCFFKYWSFLDYISLVKVQYDSNMRHLTHDCMLYDMNISHMIQIRH